MDTSSNELAHKMTWTWFKRGNILGETEFLLIAAKIIP